MHWISEIISATTLHLAASCKCILLIILTWNYVDVLNATTPKKLPIYRSFSQLQYRIDWTLFIFLRKISKHVHCAISHIGRDKVWIYIIHIAILLEIKEKIPKKKQTERWYDGDIHKSIFWTPRCHLLIQLEIFNSNFIFPPFTNACSWNVFKWTQSNLRGRNRSFLCGKLFGYRKSEKKEMIITPNNNCIHNTYI